ncbi:putative signal peptide protein [Puccinia sorghi]|uniref:Putative signal peptide protein n=1 Tax=Puccinia sorghi TaxID=27349 RepID=A0A0L6V1B5_9BASI|nr:putative signal peptide protein [Puccinia sorghi]
MALSWNCFLLTWAIYVRIAPGTRCTMSVRTSVSMTSRAPKFSISSDLARNTPTQSSSLVSLSFNKKSQQDLKVSIHCQFSNLGKPSLVLFYPISVLTLMFFSSVLLLRVFVVDFLPEDPLGISSLFFSFFMSFIYSEIQLNIFCNLVETWLNFMLKAYENFHQDKKSPWLRFNHTCCDSLLAIVLRVVNASCRNRVSSLSFKKTQSQKLNTVALEYLKTGLGESGSGTVKIWFSLIASHQESTIAKSSKLQDIKSTWASSHILNHFSPLISQSILKISLIHQHFLPILFVFILLYCFLFDSQIAELSLFIFSFSSFLHFSDYLSFLHVFLFLSRLTYSLSFQSRVVCFSVYLTFSYSPYSCLTCCFSQFVFSFCQSTPLFFQVGLPSSSVCVFWWVFERSTHQQLTKNKVLLSIQHSHFSNIINCTVSMKRFGWPSNFHCLGRVVLVLVIETFDAEWCLVDDSFHPYRILSKFSIQKNIKPYVTCHLVIIDWSWCKVYNLPIRCPVGLTGDLPIGQEAPSRHRSGILNSLICAWEISNWGMEEGKMMMISDIAELPVAQIPQSETEKSEFQTVFLEFRICNDYKLVFYLLSLQAYIFFVSTTLTKKSFFSTFVMKKVCLPKLHQGEIPGTSLSYAIAYMLPEVWFETFNMLVA